MTTIPNPPSLGDTFLNEVTGVTYEYDGEKWVIISTPGQEQGEQLGEDLAALTSRVADGETTQEQILETITNAVDLEYVLNNGAVADKGMILTDAEDTLIGIAPDEALITIASDTSKKNPRLRFTHIDEMNYPNAQAQIELDQDGTRVDFEFDQAINDVHFRFDDEEKFVLNKDGDAQFIGKVEGEPGTQNNEFVTYGQLTTLEEEIEQLAPSLERGSWTYTSNYPPAQGQYTLVKEILDEDEQEVLCQTTYTECVAAAAGNVEALNACNRNLLSCQDNIVGTKVITTAEFVEATRIYFNDIDANGTTHSWAEIPPDHFIDIFNEADENFLVGDITSHTGGNFSIDVMSSKGTASGIATVKIFKTQGSVDFDQYVRKAGDTMKGRLTINPDAATPPLYIYNHEDVTANTYSIRQFGVPYTDEEGVTQRDTVFYTTAGGDISGGVDWKPTRNQHLANVKYVHDQVNKLYYPARFSWIVKTETSAGPVSGQIQWNKTSMSDSTEVRVHFKSYDGKLDLFDVADEKVVYDGPTNSSMMITGYYIGSDTDQKWKWKGTANITKITVYKRSGDCYFKCNLGSYKTSNATFNDGGRYYFTIPGLF